MIFFVKKLLEYLVRVWATADKLTCPLTGLCLPSWPQAGHEAVSPLRGSASYFIISDLRSFREIRMTTQ